MRWAGLFWLAALATSMAWALNGCASRKGRTDTAWPQEGAGTGSKSAIVTPATGSIGRVTAVNASARFVVISYPIGVLPALEQHLSAYRNGLKVAELKVSGPARDTHTVADILAGVCQVGDEVREN